MAARNSLGTNGLHGQIELICTIFSILSTTAIIIIIIIIIRPMIDWVWLQGAEYLTSSLHISGLKVGEVFIHVQYVLGKQTWQCLPLKVRPHTNGTSSSPPSDLACNWSKLIVAAVSYLKSSLERTLEPLNKRLSAQFSARGDELKVFFCWISVNRLSSNITIIIVININVVAVKIIV